MSEFLNQLIVPILAAVLGSAGTIFFQHLISENKLKAYFTSYRLTVDGEVKCIVDIHNPNNHVVSLSGFTILLKGKGSFLYDSMTRPKVFSLYCAENDAAINHIIHINPFNTYPLGISINAEGVNFKDVLAIHFRSTARGNRFVRGIEWFQSWRKLNRKLGTREYRIENQFSKKEMEDHKEVQVG